MIKEAEEGRGKMLRIILGIGLICIGLLLIAIVLIFHPFTGSPAETTKLCDVTFGELRGLMYEMITIICGFNLATIGVCVSLVRK
jgi:hypothetical protein